MKRNRQPNGKWNTLAPFAVAFLLIAFAAGFGPPQGAKGSALKWHRLTEGLDAAKKADRKVLIDVYTDWCGWCKKMDAEVYADASVMKYLSEKYVLVKMDAESSDNVQYAGEQLSEQELAGAFGVTGYPTTLFLLPNGDPITMLPGYVAAGQFLDILTYIGENHYEKMKYEEYQSTRSSKKQK